MLETNYIKFCSDNDIPKCYFDCNVTNITNNITIFNAFIKKPFPLMIFGEPGTGKTYFMLSLLKELLDTKKYPRHMFRYFNAVVLDERIDSEIKSYNSANNFIKGLCEDHFLFIDDFGIEKSKERAERNYYTLLDNRLANCKATVITTNLKEDEILNIYGARIHSRLKQSHILHFKGEDKRKPFQL